jgi:FAD/FMN-containing dehydrogenase
MAARSTHEERSHALASQLLQAKAAGLPVCLRKSSSNLFRRRDAARQRLWLDVRPFDHVLHIDAERRIADVEGMTTYEALVEATLAQGLLPAVVPELKTITVGGAVTGLGIESSSFRHGLVHETVEAMEILTGDGSLVTCSAHENADLFFGFPNSYGTLGYALRLKVRLVPALPYVHLKHLRFDCPRDLFAHLVEACHADDGSDFLDGTVFGANELYASHGRLAAAAPQHCSDYTYRRIYYRSIRQTPADWLTVRGYIWRWDTDWFWCSKQFGLESRALRLLAKPALHSRTYQRWMRLSQKLLPDATTREAVIQDVQIPIEHAASFCDFLISDIGILPIWICPFRTSSQVYPLCPLQPDRLYINFGFWDSIPTTHPPGHFNRMVERTAADLGGAKALYSTSCYDEETFWSIYNRPAYDALKLRYDPGSLFPDLFAKCVERQ